MPTLTELLKKKFGEVLMAQGETPAPTVYLPTGITSLDRACGGGLPRGHLTIVWGMEGTGKTGLMTYPILQAQRKPIYDGQVLYIATEPKVNLGLFVRLGVDFSKLTVVRTLDKTKPVTGEMAFDIIKEAAGVAEMIVVDSVPNLVPSVVYEVAMNDAQPMAATARLLAAKLPSTIQMLSATKTALVFINHVRANLDSKTNKYLTEKQFGGWAIKQQATTTIKIRKVRLLHEGNVQKNPIVGWTVGAEIEKQSLDKPFARTEWDVTYANGVDLVRDTLRIAKAIGLVNSRCSKAGDVSLIYPGATASEAEALKRLRAEPDLYEWLVSEINKSDVAIADESTVEPNEEVEGD